MAISSAKWLGISYFTYFFCYGIYLPFWGFWLKSTGLDAEKIGLLLGCGMVARFAGSLLIASRMQHPTQLIIVLRWLALMTCLFAGGYWIGQQWLWLLLVMVGFNLFFSPLVPLSDALAAIWNQQIGLKYGPVRLWGSLAFVISSVLTGLLVNYWSSQAILTLLSVGVIVMLVGMLLSPLIKPQDEVKQVTTTYGAWQVWPRLLREKNVWHFMLCIMMMQGAHAAYYGFSAIWWQQSGYSASVVGYLWSLGVVAEVLIFASSDRLFQYWSARDLLLLSGICALARWVVLGATTVLPWLIVAQILHCGSFTVCHLAAMRFISAHSSTDVIQLQSLYSALGMGGGLALMTIVCGVLYTYLQGHLFWAMALVVLPALFLRPRTF
ncbi:3-phenylpropionate MFS transporter [Pantoea sp. Nvir]|uniref:3-phenylpropionate MFS transporter n=1 Tax=Pantoea sp. Nvir TaxID=2576760 RepID=UPI0013591E2F|nr:3-phenylpropionate MFS transporter [Pantoea sp. Nvir]MXP66545.1 3-phenylpropionate MFS transporter [Pantoea sp. Nvir]CAJ0992246.1 putative 3-phenylpropionic acid transporter [Pantoea sp. Nvir]